MSVPLRHAWQVARNWDDRLNEAWAFDMPHAEDGPLGCIEEAVSDHPTGQHVGSAASS